MIRGSIVESESAQRFLKIVKQFIIKNDNAETSSTFIVSQWWSICTHICSKNRSWNKHDVILNISQEQENTEFLPQAQPIVQTKQPQTPPIRKSIRGRERERNNAILDYYVIFLQEREDDIGLTEEDPINFSQSMWSPNSLKYIDTMKNEMKSMADNNVWDLVNLPEGKKPIGRQRL